MADYQQKKLLLAQLNSNGDCLYATVIAKQIKEVDYPGAHLTWAVNTKCKQSVLLNPHVDEIWEVPTLSAITSYDEWELFVQDAERRKASGEFDEIFYTQIIGAGVLDFDGGIRSTTYLHYPHPVTVDQHPVIRLSDEEVEAVKKFAADHLLKSFKQVLLVECGPDSFVSPLNPHSATIMAERLTQNNPDLAVILSSNKKIETASKQIIDGSSISFRANAELTKYCTLFAGCSSGISWLTTADWAKPLPKVLIISEKNYYTGSMVYDHRYAHLPVNNIIELQEDETAVHTLETCLTEILNGSFEQARKKFHVDFKLSNFKFLRDIASLNKRNGNHAGLFTVTRNVIRRNGLRKVPVFLFIKMFLKLPIHLVKFKKKRVPEVNR